MPILLRGKNLGLRSLESTDIKKIAEWLNSAETTRFMFYGRLPSTNKQVKKLFESYQSSNKNAVFMVVDIKSGLAIGFGGLFKIDYVAKKAEPIMLIGERKFWGQTYGMEGFTLITHYGFEKLKLNMMYGGVTRPDTRGAEKFYEFLGYKINGVRKEMAYRNGIYYDGIMIDILRKEYYPKILESYQKNFGIRITNEYSYAKQKQVVSGGKISKASSRYGVRVNKKFLEGENIIFRPYQSDDALLIHRWIKKERQGPLILQQVRDSIEQQIDSDRNVILVVTKKDKDEAIGLAGLYEIDYIARRAEIRIVFGDEKYWSSGHGREVIELLTYYGFDRLNLNRIYLGYPADNKKVAKNYEKAGYVYEGTIREDIYHNGQYCNTTRVAILRKDYFENFYKSHSERFKQSISKKIK